MLYDRFVRADKWIIILTVSFLYGHSMHEAMLLDMVEKMQAEASFESVNVFGCLNIIRYFIPQPAPSLCETSAAVSGVNMGIK